MTLGSLSSALDAGLAKPEATASASLREVDDSVGWMEWMAFFI